ncbi:MAG: Uma2 family endonuclease [Tunicatimonas sp.]
MTTDVARRLFTINEYHRMAEAGILHEDDRTELIHGEIIYMSPIGNYHAAVVRRLNTLLSPLVAPQAIVDVQNPVKIGDHSEPEPDIKILPFREDYYAESGVTPQDVLLLIEVSDSTLRYDRNTKLPLYATAGIPEVWIVDVNKQQLEVHRQPNEERYQFMETLTRDDSVTATQLPLNVRVRELIG